MSQRVVMPCFAETAHEVDALKVRSSLDTVKQEISKLTGAKKHGMIVGQIEPCAQDSLQRFKRGRKAFGSRVESRFVATSVQGIATAKCGAMTYLDGDTFFNRWPVKLIPVTDLKQMDEQAYEKMWESVPGLHPQKNFGRNGVVVLYLKVKVNNCMQDVTADRELAEDGADDGGLDISIDESKVIPFPHEHHWTLCQEFLEVFGGASTTTLIDLSVGSGAKLLGVLLSNGRAVGVVRSQSHRKWVMQNLIDWVKQKRLVNVTPLAKPQVSCDPSCLFLTLVLQ